MMIKRVLNITSILVFLSLSAFAQPNSPSPISNQFAGTASCTLSWANLVGVSENAGTITKTASGDSWNTAGASSTNVLPAGVDGFISWTLHTSAVYSVGFALTDNDQSIITGYALRVVNGTLHADINGPASGTTSLGSFTDGQTAILHREGSDLKYYLDGALIHTMSSIYQGNLIVDMAINTGNLSVGSIDTDLCTTKADISWTNLVGVSESNGTITETEGTTAWNTAGASSENILLAGDDGWLAWNLSRNMNHIYILGLSAYDINTNYNTVDYGFRLVKNTLYIDVDGSNVATASSAISENAQVVIKRSGTNILFYYDGTLAHTASNAYQGNMIADLAIRKAGISISGITASFADTDCGIDWANLQGASYDGTTLTKTLADGWGNAGALSSNEIANGEDGWYSWRMSSTGGIYTMGLGQVSRGIPTNYNQVDYTFRVVNSTIYVDVNGTQAVNLGSFAVNTGNQQAVIRKVSNEVIFYFEGEEVHRVNRHESSTLAPSIAIRILGTSIPTGNIDVGICATTSFSRLPSNYVNLSEESKMSVYPNPSKGMANIHIATNANQTSTISIYNNIGQMVRQAQVVSDATGQLLYQTDLTGIKAGIYIVRIFADSKFHTAKLVIE